MRRNIRSILMAVGRLLLFVALLAVPSLVRAGYFYRRPPAAAEVPRPDLAEVNVFEVETGAHADVEAVPGRGQVLIDRAHKNVVDNAELNVLLSRLTTRGMEAVSLGPEDMLPDRLRTASALVVISPHQAYSPQEAAAVQRFVEQGGRLLLAADPSRYTFVAQSDDLYGDMYVAQSDVAAINSLGSLFGLAFADDYLYNAVENAGNYQYIVVRSFADSPVTAELERVVLYAARSLATAEEALATSDAETVSSLSERSGDLAPLALGGDGRVLAVGDFTFMTEPYSSVADNGRLVTNIADFLAGGVRTFGLTEFPHFFGDHVQLVSVQDERHDAALPASTIDEAARLQAAFEAADKRLHWRDAPEDVRDAFYLGLYEGVAQLPEVSEILAGQGITFTLETAERARAALTPTATPRFTPTPAPDLDTTPMPTPRPLRDWIHMPGVGPVDAKETALYYQNEHEGRQVLIVLAFEETGLRAATHRLLSGDFASCLLDDDRKADAAVVGLALCPTAYEPPEPTATPTPTPTPEVEGNGEPPVLPEVPLGGVLIVSDDDGEGVYEWWTSAYQLRDIAADAGYEALVWSTDFDGPIAADLLAAYDAVLWCTGDYLQDGGSPTDDEFSVLGTYLDEGGNLLLMGAFVGDTEDREQGLVLDIQVARTGHPLTGGFDDGQVITLERFTADEDYAAFVMSDVDEDSIAWTRGPDSEYAGEAVVSFIEDDLSGSRIVVVGVPLYLFPYDEGALFGTNVILWLLEE